MSTAHLRNLFSLDAPVLSCFVDRRREDTGPVMVRWEAQRERLAGEGATQDALDAVTERLSLPVPEDDAGQAVFAAPDGTALHEFGPEPPRFDVARLDTLAWAGPVLEWAQSRIEHLVVGVSEAVASEPGSVEIVSFGYDRVPEIRPVIGGPDEAVDPVVQAATELRARLVIVGGAELPARRLTDLLVSALPSSVHVVRDDNLVGPDAVVADAVVRHVSDAAARRTVDHLEEFRFLREHGGAVEGEADAVAALAAGACDLLLVHDDPADERRARFGESPRELSLDDPTLPSEGRLVDACIRSAVLQGAAVHVIPSTGRRGPAGDIAVLRFDPAVPALVDG